MRLFSHSPHTNGDAKGIKTAIVLVRTYEMSGASNNPVSQDDAKCCIYKHQKSFVLLNLNLYNLAKDDRFPTQDEPAIPTIGTTLFT